MTAHGTDDDTINTKAVECAKALITLSTLDAVLVLEKAQCIVLFHSRVTEPLTSGSLRLALSEILISGKDIMREYDKSLRD